MKQKNIAVTKIALLRHAATEMNINKDALGQVNDQLAPEAEARAQKWGKVLNRFKWDRILTSHQGRARQTAEIINQSLNLSIQYHNGLCDQDWGEWTGRLMDDLLVEAPGFRENSKTKNWRFLPPGGESYEAVLQRSMATLQDAHNQYPGDTILVVIPEGVIRCLINFILEQHIKPGSSFIYLANQMHWIRWHGKDVRVEEMNALPLPS
jgi:probable phosphoglycerate mutase